MEIKITLNPNTGKENSVAGLIRMCGQRANVHAVVNEFINERTEEREYQLLFTDLKDAKLFVYEWFFAFSFADHDFTNVAKSDVSIEAKDQDLINHIMVNTQRATAHDIELLDMIVSDLTTDQENMRRRITAIEEYIKGSGVIYYQQFMKELIDVLDARDIVDKESVIAKMFNTFH